MSTSSTGWWTWPSTIECRTDGARSRIAAQREIERRQNADKSYLDEGVALLDLARNAQRLFAKQEPREKRQLLNFVLSNCTWRMVKSFPRSVNLLTCLRKP